MALQFSYTTVGPLTIAGSYFGENLEQPYQFEIDIVPKDVPALGNEVDFVIRETNIGIERKVSQIDVLSSLDEVETGIGLELFPMGTLLEGHLDKAEEFIFINKDYFQKQIKKYQFGSTRYKYNILEIDIIIAFGELLGRIVKDKIAFS